MSLIDRLASLVAWPIVAAAWEVWDFGRVRRMTRKKP